MDKYDETHRIISNMAGVKMRMNNHKGNIEDYDPIDIIDLLKKEVAELEDAIREGDMLHTIEEAADCFNFLVALTHQQVEKYRKRNENTRHNAGINSKAVQHSKNRA